MVDSGDPRYRDSTVQAACRARPAALEAYQTIEINPTKVRCRNKTYRLEIKSDKTWPNRRVSLSVPKRCL